MISVSVLLTLTIEILKIYETNKYYSDKIQAFALNFSVVKYEIL